MNRFEKLSIIGKSLTDDQGLLHRLEEGKRYLKTRYPLDCSVDSELTTHNIHYALSDKNKALSEAQIRFRHQYDINISGKINDEDKRYDVKTSINDIISYIKHLIRDAQQSNGCHGEY